MEKIREKAIENLNTQVDYLREYADSNDYYIRACSRAWAYYEIGLITIDECSEWIVKFAEAYCERTGK